MNIRNVQLTVTRQQYSNLESAADLVRTDVIELLGVEGLDQDTSAKISQFGSTCWGTAPFLKAHKTQWAMPSRRRIVC